MVYVLDSSSSMVVLFHKNWKPKQVPHGSYAKYQTQYKTSSKDGDQRIPATVLSWEKKPQNLWLVQRQFSPFYRIFRYILDRNQ